MSVPNDSEGSEEGEWLDLESDEEAIAIVSLFDAKTFPTAAAMLHHCKQHHNFDFAGLTRRLLLDFHGAVKLVNYIRYHVENGLPLPTDISLNDFNDDRYLQPVMENDALIFSLDEVLESEESNQVDASLESGELDGHALRVRNKELQAELEKVQAQFSNYRLAVQQTLDQRWGDDTEPGPPGTSSKKDDSAYYFESYASHGMRMTNDMGSSTTPLTRVQTFTRPC